MRRYLLAISLLLSLLAIQGVTMAFAVPVRVPQLDVHFLSVGQGDSILITTPMGRRILVDTGPDETTLRQELHAVLPPLTERIDLLILTHSDADHIGGAAMVLREYSVTQVLLNQETEPKEGIEEVLALAKQKGIPVTKASREHDIEVDPWTRLDILTPLPNFAPESANDQSIVFMLITPMHRLLFTGDAEAEAEKAFVTSGAALHAQWLKGGHHGSKTSSTKPFIDAVRPQTVIFQNGEGNSYGHPSQEVMDRLAEAQIPVYNTSVIGRIHLQCPLEAPCILTPQHVDSS